MVIDMPDQGFLLRTIAASFGLGAPDSRCDQGPEAVLAAFGQQDLSLSPTDGEGPEILANFMTQLAKVVSETLQDRVRLAILSGDHSCAIGTWRGVKHMLDAPVGLIWIDAHMDAHTFETTPSGCWHGMPVAALLGQGELGKAGAVILPSNLCLLGIRSFESAEAELLQSLGVKVITMEEINRIGFQTAMVEAIAIATAGTAGFGISIDLDGIDPSEAPGVGSPVAGGIHATDLLTALEDLQTNPLFRAIEVAEYNPELDKEQRTLKLVVQILNRFSGAMHESNY